MFFITLTNIFAEEIDQEELNIQQIASMTAEAFKNTRTGYIESETIEKLTINIIGTLSKQFSNKLLTRNYRKGFNKFLAEVIKKGSFKGFLNKKFTNSFKKDILWIPADIFIEYVKIYTMKESKVDERYKQPIVWWLDILYTDFKASFNPNKIAGAVDFLIGNGKVLADMSNQINNELKKYGQLKWEVKYSEARYKIFEYEAKALRQYTQAFTIKEKKKVISNFKIVCESEKISGNLFGYGYKDLFNTKIISVCYRGIYHIESFEKNKFKPLTVMLFNNDKKTV